MRAHILVFLIVSILTVNLKAGDFHNTGIKIGYNHSTISGNNLPGKTVFGIPGFSIGGYYSYRFNERFSLKQELLLATKGCIINTVGDINLYNIFVYLEIPVLAQITLKPHNKLNPIIYCGPAISNKIVSLNFVGIVENVRKVDCGLIFGAGIEYWKLSLDLRFNRSLIDFDLSDEKNVLKNQSVSVLAGFSF
ncbi:MAG: PorT family protein [Candidatus Marinimicrobia bacterium]|nr:PorT family protein [Candidatus Neomarinimicrobiota bacterium]MBL7113220.1 PorT family protein [Bacteroidales bacterium]